jgi:DNA-binding NtrC family response regulator
MEPDRKILIVDDEKNIRMTLAQALESLELSSETAINGEEALSKIDDEKKEFEVVLLDLKMPGMDGLEVLHRIRDRQPNIKVIIISAHGTIESATEAMKLGAVDFIQKPFSPKEIRNLVKKVIDREKIEEEDAKSYGQHIELAKKSIGQRNFDTALKHVKQAVAVDASKPEAFNLMGVLTELKGDKIECQKHYRAALALDPTYKAADENLSRVTSLKSEGSINLDNENRNV